jgi:hypothetical protein
MGQKIAKQFWRPLKSITRILSKSHFDAQSPASAAGNRNWQAGMRLQPAPQADFGQHGPKPTRMLRCKIRFGQGSADITRLRNIQRVNYLDDRVTRRISPANYQTIFV